MMRYSGHLFFDIGVATITAFADKTDPDQVTENDLEMVADYICLLYTSPSPRD